MTATDSMQDVSYYRITVDIQADAQPPREWGALLNWLRDQEPDLFDVAAVDGTGEMIR